MGRSVRTLFIAAIVLAGATLETPGAECVQDLGIDGANSVSPDGNVVAGAIPASSWRWISGQGWTDLGGAGGQARLSRDGSTVVANDFDSDGTTNVAATWRDGIGWRRLGALPGDTGCGDVLSSSYGVSGDGKKVVGLGWQFCISRAFEWTADEGMREPQEGCPRGPGASGRCRANNVSDDGRVIVGWEDDSLTAYRRCVRWEDGVGSTLQSAGTCGQVWAVNNDGSVVAGEGAGINGNEAYRWTGGAGVELLGNLPTPQRSYGVSDDGRVIVGSYGIGEISVRTAWIWTESNGMETLADHLSGAGCTDLAGWLFWEGVDVSADGSFVVGRGSFNGVPTSFLATTADQPDGAVGEATGVVLGKAAGDDLDLSWSATCNGDETDYALYEGSMGDYKSHASVACTTGGSTSTSLTPLPGNRYFIVVAHDGSEEGAYGETSWAGERAQGASPCFPRSIRETCP